MTTNFRPWYATTTISRAICHRHAKMELHKPSNTIFPTFYILLRGLSLPQLSIIYDISEENLSQMQPWRWSTWFWIITLSRCKICCGICRANTWNSLLCKYNQCLGEIYDNLDSMKRFNPIGRISVYGHSWNQLCMGSGIDWTPHFTWQRMQLT